MTREEIEALFRRRIAAYNRRDAEALAADHLDDCVLESPTAGHVSGRTLITEVYRTWFAAFPDLSFTLDELLVDGDRASMFASVHGTHVGGFMGLPPSGKRFKFSVAIICHLKDGKIAHERRIFDFTGMLVQIGMLKAKPA